MMQRSTESVALLAPKWLVGFEQRLWFAVALLDMAGAWRYVFLCLFAGVCVAVRLLRRRGLVVLKLAISLAPTLFGLGAFSAIGVDALLCKVVCSAASGNQNTPSITEGVTVSWAKANRVARTKEEVGVGLGVSCMLGMLTRRI